MINRLSKAVVCFHFSQIVLPRGQDHIDLNTLLGGRTPPLENTTVQSAMFAFLPAYHRRSECF